MISEASITLAAYFCFVFNYLEFSSFEVPYTDPYLFTIKNYSTPKGKLRYASARWSFVQHGFAIHIIPFRSLEFYRHSDVASFLALQYSPWWDINPYCYTIISPSYEVQERNWHNRTNSRSGEWRLYQGKENVPDGPVICAAQRVPDNARWKCPSGIWWNHPEMQDRQGP